MACFLLISKHRNRESITEEQSKMYAFKSGTMVAAVLAGSMLAGSVLASPLISAQLTGPSFGVLNLGTALSAGFQSSSTIMNPTFDIASIAFSGGSSSGGTQTASGLYAGNTANVATSPFPTGLPGNSLQNYLVAQAKGGTVTVTYNSWQTSVDILWGTADYASGYNLVTGNGDQITGADILAAAGLPSSDTGKYNIAVEITALQPFESLTFSDSTSKSAFEFAVGEVPEPGTLALMSIGLAALGWMVQRRRQSNSAI